MKKVIFIVLAILITISIASSLPIGEPKTIEATEDTKQYKYTANTVEVCDRGTCTLTILPNRIYTEDSDGKWKLIKDAKSLKKSHIKPKIISDGIHRIKVIDYNLTSISVELNLTGMKVNQLKKYAIKYYDLKDNELRTLTDSIEQWSRVGDYIYATLNYNISESIHFGEESTILTLDNPDDQVTEDTYFLPAKSNQTQGAVTTLRVNYDSDGSDHEMSFIKFNISEIPANQLILNAMLNLTIEFNGLDAGESYTISSYRYDNQTWLEGTGDGSDPPETVLPNELTPDNFDSSQIIKPATDSTLISTGDSGVDLWNITTAVNYSYSNSETYSSIALNVTSIGGTPNWIDRLSWRSKEHPSSGLPTLKITYKDDFDAPTASLNQTNSTTAGTDIYHSTYFFGEAGMDTYIFSFCNGTFNRTSNTCEGEANNLDYSGKNCNVDGSASTWNIGCGTPNNKNEDSTDATMDSCTDGSSNDYMHVEDIDINATTVQYGDVIHVTCNICSYSTGTEVAIAYNNGSGWTNVYYGSASGGSGSSFCTYYDDYEVDITVDNVIGTHYVRCLESWSGSAGMTCDASDSYTDADDISFEVVTPVEEWGLWKNDTVAEFGASECSNSTNTSCWVNVTKPINSTVGIDYAFCVYANDNWDRWINTCNPPHIYTSTAGEAPADTCTCPADSNTDHVFDQGDFCSVSTCIAQDIYFSGSGHTSCTGSWSVRNIYGNVTNGLLNGSSGCTITITT